MTEAAAPPYGYPSLPADPAGPVERVRWWAELGVGLAVLVVVGLLGFPMGWLWQRIAPHTPAVRESDGAYLTVPEAEHRIADEGWYMILMIALGLVLAIVVWIVLRRFRGPVLMLGLVLGSIACALVTWKFGHHFGYAHARALIDAPNWTGTTNFVLPVDLRVAKIGLWHGWLPFARGDVLAMPITALLMSLLLVGFSPYPALRPTHRFPEGGDLAPYPAYAPWTPVSYGQPSYGQPADGQPAYEQAAHGQPAYGQPAYGQPAQGQPAYGQPAQGQPAYGQPAYGQPAAGQAPYGQPPYGPPPAGGYRPVHGATDGQPSQDDRPDPAGPAAG